MVADADTLTLLSKHGFRVDSSHPSFQRPVNGPYETHGLVEAEATTGMAPFLVFLAHPWEFFAHETGPFDVGYCSPDNFAMLRRRLARLAQTFELDYLTIKELGAASTPEAGGPHE